MSRDYKAESIQKFPLQATPFKDNYAKEGDYKCAYSKYKQECNAIMAHQQEWINEEKEADQWAEEATEARRHESARGKSVASLSQSKGEGSGKGKQQAEVEVMAVSGVGETLPDSEWCGQCVL